MICKLECYVQKGLMFGSNLKQNYFLQEKKKIKKIEHFPVFLRFFRCFSQLLFR